jgi:uncharacterized membrane protein
MTTTARTAPESRRSIPVISDGPLAIAMLVIILLGIGDAGYLVYVHYAKLTILCVGGHAGHSSCETVQSSAYAKLAGVPVALLGLIGYLCLLVTCFIRGEWSRTAALAIAGTGFGFSMYLTYREIFTIKAICEWCVGSATFMTLLTIIAAIRWYRDA